MKIGQLSTLSWEKKEEERKIGLGQQSINFGLQLGDCISWVESEHLLYIIIGLLF